MTSAPPEESAGRPDGAGESRAQLIAKLFREHNEALLRFLAARMGSRHEAKEVAQEAYLRILSLDRPGAVSFLRAFLFRTAANLAIDRMRSADRRRKIGEVAFFETFEDTLTPERAAASTQEIDAVMRRLEELPPKCRQAFLLNRIHGLEPTEIALQMNIAERTARHYILRAFVHCRTAMDDGRSHQE